MTRRTATPEAAVLSACLSYLTTVRGWLCWRNQTTGLYDPTRQCFRTFQGLKGVSDILGVLPDGRLLAVETKSPSGRLSPEQSWFLAELNRRGGLGIVVRSVGDLEEALLAEGY